MNRRVCTELNQRQLLKDSQRQSVLINFKWSLPVVMMEVFSVDHSSM